MAIGKNAGRGWQVARGEHRVDALSRKGGSNIDFDIGARHLAPNDDNVQHFWKSHVVDIAAATDNKIVVLGTNLPPPELTHKRPPNLFLLHVTPAASDHSSGKLRFESIQILPSYDNMKWTEDGKV